jgi:SAM-dependent methyltransferase
VTSGIGGGRDFAERPAPLCAGRPRPVNDAAVTHGMSTRCRACGAVGARPFYAVDHIPVNSCLLVETEAAALAFAKGDLELACCPACGFIQNRRFVPDATTYSAAYEETQAYSPRFMRFVDELVDDLDRRYRLAGKTVLEIGCGKGDFLVRLVERTGARGIGIDPAYRHERTKTSAADRLRFLAEPYTADHGDLGADLICCRHTLEHVAEVGTFLRSIRRGIGERSDVALFFELPDTWRILAEAAFWDVYYEHCSYFTAGSLARLFRGTGFIVTRLRRAYDGQYLLLEARPAAAGEVGEALPAEEDPAAIIAAAATFERIVGAKLEALRRALDGWARDGRRVVLWGSGSKAVGYLTTLGVRDEVLAVVDINPHKAGQYLAGSGHRIEAPARLPELAPDVVVVMNPIYAAEIEAELNALGLAPQLVCLT